MKANELRLGNYTEYNIIDEDRDEWIFNEVEISDLGDVSYLRPIPLTEEWLLKFGFEKKGNRYYLRGLKIRFYEGVSVSYGAQYLFEIINYPVHKLQNLYFALTGKELTIN